MDIPERKPGVFRSWGICIICKKVQYCDARIGTGTEVTDVKRMMGCEHPMRKVNPITEADALRELRELETPSLPWSSDSAMRELWRWFDPTQQNGEVQSYLRYQLKHAYERGRKDEREGRESNDY